MNIWLKILLAAALLAFLYGVYCLIAICFARYEMNHSDAFRQKGGEIEVFAEAHSLEYYVRVAMSSAGERTPVVAYIKSDSAEFQEMVDVAERLQREYSNLEFRIME